jgi:hypothetical protein
VLRSPQRTRHIDPRGLPPYLLSSAFAFARTFCHRATNAPLIHTGSYLPLPPRRDDIAESPAFNFPDLLDITRKRARRSEPRHWETRASTRVETSKPPSSRPSGCDLKFDIPRCVTCGVNRRHFSSEERNIARACREISFFAKSGGRRGIKRAWRRYDDDALFDPLTRRSRVVERHRRRRGSIRFAPGGKLIFCGRPGVGSRSYINATPNLFCGSLAETGSPFLVSSVPRIGRTGNGVPSRGPRALGRGSS